MDLKELQIISSEYKELRDQLDNAKATLSGDSNSNSIKNKVKVLESACTEMARKLRNQCNNIKLLMGKVPSAETAVKTFQEKAKNQGVLTMQQEKTIESLLNRMHSRVAEAKNAVATAEQTLMRPTTNKIKIIYPMTGQTNNSQPPPAATGGEFPAD
jgi:chromosome segregation ATPase